MGFSCKRQLKLVEEGGHWAQNILNTKMYRVFASIGGF